MSWRWVVDAAAKLLGGKQVRWPRPSLFFCPSRKVRASGINHAKRLTRQTSRACCARYSLLASHQRSVPRLSCLSFSVPLATQGERRREASGGKTEMQPSFNSRQGRQHQRRSAQLLLADCRGYGHPARRTNKIFLADPRGRWYPFEHRLCQVPCYSLRLWEPRKPTTCITQGAWTPSARSRHFNPFFGTVQGFRAPSISSMQLCESRRGRGVWRLSSMWRYQP